MALARSYAEYYGGLADADLPSPNKVLAGVAYGAGGVLVGTAPESLNPPIPQLVRGDDYTTASSMIRTIVSDPGDLGSLASYTVVFGGYHPDFKLGWKVTDGTVVDLGNGLLELRSPLPSAATLPCKPGCDYEWSHSLVDAGGKIHTQKTGVTNLIDGYAVDRYSE